MPAKWVGCPKSANASSRLSEGLQFIQRRHSEYREGTRLGARMGVFASGFVPVVPNFA